MSSQTRDLLHACLLFLCASAFVCVHGKPQGSNPPCDLALFVERGTRQVAAPGEGLTLKCPVEHCGEPVKVVWCKERDTCEDIFPTEDVEIVDAINGDDRLLSLLKLKRISREDAGLYRCYVNKGQREVISHAVQVVVSDLNGRVEPKDDIDEIQKTGESNDPASEYSTFLLPLLLIGIGITALVSIVIVLPVVKGYCQKRTMTFNPANVQERSNHMIPDLPPRGDPHIFLQQGQPMYLNRFTEMPTSQVNVDVDAQQLEGVMYSSFTWHLPAPGGR